MKMGWWKLDEQKNPVYLGEGPEAILLLKDYDSEDRRVALDLIGNFRVSTVFLALDHNYADHGPPVLFETMVFEDDKHSDLACERYSTWDQAMTGHKRMVAAVHHCLATSPMVDAEQLENFLAAQPIRVGPPPESSPDSKDSQTNSASDVQEEE